MEFISPISVAEFGQMIHNVLNMDKDTMHTLAYAAYLYIMMDRFTVPARRRVRR